MRLQTRWLRWWKWRGNKLSEIAFQKFLRVVGGTPTTAEGVSLTSSQMVIPAFQIKRGDDFPSIKVSGSFWHYDENGTGATPFASAPLDPISKSFSHVFNSSKANLPPPSIRLGTKL